MKADVLGTADRRLIAEVSSLARRVGRDLKQGRARVNVIFVSNCYIHALNKRYLKRDRPTDVLAFPISDVRSPIGNRQMAIADVCGEVYVSRDQARIQAREHGVSYRAELLRLVLHGILHLCGLSHARMKPYESRYL